MSYGLRIWDPFGRLTLDTSRRMKLHYMDAAVGAMSVGQQVWVPVSGMTPSAEWLVVVHGMGVVGMSVVLPILGHGGFTARAEGFYSSAPALLSIYRG